eukprot:g1018.t1
MSGEGDSSGVNGEELPHGDFVPCALTIFALGFGIPYVVLGAGAGAIRIAATLTATLLVAFLLAYRDVLCGCHRRSGVQSKVVPADAGADTTVSADAVTKIDDTGSDITERRSSSDTDRSDTETDAVYPWPAHTPPVIYPTHGPTPEYVAHCDAVARYLEHALLATPDEGRRDDLLQLLQEKYGLQYTTCGQGSLSWAPTRRNSLFGGTRRASATAVCAPKAVTEPAKMLRSLAMRYPASADPLGRGPFEWAPHKAPLRAGGAAALDAALPSWADRTTSAADSALFSSLGVWISPYAVPFLRLCALAFALLGLALLSGGGWSTFPLTIVVCCVVPVTWFTTAQLLRAGRRPLAVRCFAAGCKLTALLYVAEATLITYGRAWVYGRAHAHPVLEYGWQYSANAVLAAAANFVGAALAAQPGRSFHILFLAAPTTYLLRACVFATNHLRFHGLVAQNLACAATCYGLGAFLWPRRQRALALARYLGVVDAARYDAAFLQLLERQAGFRKELGALRGAWNQAMDGAVVRARLQLGAKGLGELFEQADLLNDLLQAKCHSLCAPLGGRLHACDVKGEARAMQKLHRTYGGQWRQLNDLCRASMVFDTLGQMTACLRAIAADDELLLVRTGAHKMRLREDFDAAALSGGYRDVQLTVVLSSPEARARGAHEHLAEVQLHLSAFVDLKSEGGHRSYVTRRNLKGE